MERLIKQTELTTVITREGKIVIPIDEKEQYSFFSKYNVGIRDGYQKNLARGEVGSFLTKFHGEDESEYKMQMAEELAKRDKRCSEKGIEEGWVISNEKALTDMGELIENIYSHQVEQMKQCPTGYIRDGRNTFYLQTVDKSSWGTIIALKSLNEGNFVKSDYDSEWLECVVTFKNRDVKIPEYCYVAHGCIYDADEDIKVCRMQIM